jgi:hypothetical protein
VSVPAWFQGLRVEQVLKPLGVYGGQKLKAAVARGTTPIQLHGTDGAGDRECDEGQAQDDALDTGGAADLALQGLFSCRCVRLVMSHQRGAAKQADGGHDADLASADWLQPQGRACRRAAGDAHRT